MTSAVLRQKDSQKSLPFIKAKPTVGWLALQFYSHAFICFVFLRFLSLRRFSLPSPLSPKNQEEGKKWLWILMEISSGTVIVMVVKLLILLLSSRKIRLWILRMRSVSLVLVLLVSLISQKLQTRGSNKLQWIPTKRFFCCCTCFCFCFDCVCCFSFSFSFISFSPMDGPWILDLFLWCLC